MYDVTGVNVFPRKLMEFPRKEKVNSVSYLLLIFVQLWLKSISCYMIDQLCVFLYSRSRLFNGLRYCHENFLQYFHPFTWYVMVLKKSASCVIDTPLLPPWSIAFRYFLREWKKKKTDTDTSGIFDKYSCGGKSALLLSRILFLKTEKQETYFSALHIHVVIDVTI